VSQEGTLIAVSAESVTARSANGYTQTYRVSPNTTLVTAGFNAGQSQTAATTSRFKVNDEVEIVGRSRVGRHWRPLLLTATPDKAASADGLR